MEFLSGALDPPAWQAISRAMSILHEVGACVTDVVDGQGRPVLTALGQHLAMLPVSVRLAKMLVYAAVFGCQEPAVSISSGDNNANKNKNDNIINNNNTRTMFMVLTS